MELYIMLINCFSVANWTLASLLFIFSKKNSNSITIVSVIFFLSLTAYWKLCVLCQKTCPLESRDFFFITINTTFSTTFFNEWHMLAVLSFLALQSCPHALYLQSGDFFYWHLPPNFFLSFLDFQWMGYFATFSNLHCWSILLRPNREYSKRCVSFRAFEHLLPCTGKDHRQFEIRQ